MKHILPHLMDADSFIRLFLAEARLVPRHTHSHVLRTYDLGRVEEQNFIAMECVHGVHASVLIEHRHISPPSSIASYI